MNQYLVGINKIKYFIGLEIFPMTLYHFDVDAVMRGSRLRCNFLRRRRR